jgi:CDP-diglyceride synthetase
MCGSTVNLFQLAISGLLFLLMLVQLVFAAIRTIHRMSSKAPLKGWLIYWAMIVLLAVCIYGGAFANEEAFVLLVACVTVPGIWFFFAGKVSDKFHQRTQHSTLS